MWWTQPSSRKTKSIDFSRNRCAGVTTIGTIITGTTAIGAGIATTGITGIGDGIIATGDGTITTGTIGTGGEGAVAFSSEMQDGSFSLNQNRRAGFPALCFSGPEFQHSKFRKRANKNPAGGGVLPWCSR
jgi:hypothetical protein